MITDVYLSIRCKVVRLDGSDVPEGQLIDLIGNVGGAYRDRTDDPLLAKQMLSQLS